MSAFRIFFPLVVLFLCAIPIRAAEKPAQQTGEKLVRQLFIDMKSTNIPVIQKIISPAFQSIHQDGPRNRDQQIELVKGLKMAMPVLGDFVETRSGNILIVTYTVSAEESVGGKRLTGKPARRLTVFQETPDGWRWVAHANLQIMQ